MASSTGAKSSSCWGATRQNFFLPEKRREARSETDKASRTNQNPQGNSQTSIVFSIAFEGCFVNQIAFSAIVLGLSQVVSGPSASPQLVGLAARLPTLLIPLL